MRKILFFFSLATAPFICDSQIISTIAGNGIQGYSGDGGPASTAELYNPPGVAVDNSGNIYIGDFLNQVVRRVNTLGIISTIAGNYSMGHGYSGDGGPATAAELFDPDGIAVDIYGNIFIADWHNCVIRKVNTLGTISTIAGNYTYGCGYSGDGGAATAAEISTPLDVAVDSSGNIFIAEEGNYTIRKVNTTGTIYTIAGNYTLGRGYSGDGGPATNAELNIPTSVAVDGFRNIYITDQDNNVIRKVDSSGIITTIAGNHAFGYGYSGDGGPATAAELGGPYGVAVDGSGNIFISDVGNEVIRTVNHSGIISTVAGNFTFGHGFSGDGGPATDAELWSPGNISIDQSNNLFIADELNERIRKVTNITTGLLCATLKPDFSIYPNPATNIIYIQTSKINFPVTLEIADITGRVIFEKTLELQSQSQMDISSLLPGIYFVILKTKTEQLTSKIVKE